MSGSVLEGCIDAGAGASMERRGRVAADPPAPTAQKRASMMECHWKSSAGITRICVAICKPAKMPNHTSVLASDTKGDIDKG
jgi:hypothetical protein